MTTTDERLDRLEKAVAETTRWVKADWRGAVAERSAAGQILGEQRAADLAVAEREAQVRAEVQAEVDDRVKARMAAGEVNV